jgi:hypothetical protein
MEILGDGLGRPLMQLLQPQLGHLLPPLLSGLRAPIPLLPLDLPNTSLVLSLQEEEEEEEVGEPEKKPPGNERLLPAPPQPEHRLFPPQELLRSNPRQKRRMVSKPFRNPTSGSPDEVVVRSVCMHSCLFLAVPLIYAFHSHTVGHDTPFSLFLMISSGPDALVVLYAFRNDTI